MAYAQARMYHVRPWDHGTRESTAAAATTATSGGGGGGGGWTPATPGMCIKMWVSRWIFAPRSREWGERWLNARLGGRGGIVFRTVGDDGDCA